MYQSKNAATSPDAGPANPPEADPDARSVSEAHTPWAARIKPVPVSDLPQEVRDVLVAAGKLYSAIGEHAPGILLPQEVEQEWKRLGECLAWLQR